MSNGQTESSRRDETMPGCTVVGKYAYTCPLVWSHRTHRVNARRCCSHGQQHQLCWVSIASIADKAGVKGSGGVLICSWP